MDGWLRNRENVKEVIVMTFFGAKDDDTCTVHARREDDDAHIHAFPQYIHVLSAVFQP
jgi:hypothetical protein